MEGISLIETEDLKVFCSSSRNIQISLESAGT